MAPSRLKWTSPVLVRLKHLAEHFSKEERQLQIRPGGVTYAQRQIMVAGGFCSPFKCIARSTVSLLHVRFRQYKQTVHLLRILGSIVILHR